MISFATRSLKLTKELISFWSLGSRCCWSSDSRIISRSFDLSVRSSALLRKWTFRSEAAGEFEEEADEGKEEDEIERGERGGEFEKEAAPEVGEQAEKKVEDDREGDDGSCRRE